MFRLVALALFVSCVACAGAPPPLDWKKLATEPYKGKQDDIFFVNPELGFYVNGAGKIYKTTDGGQSWVLKADQPGTYFRAVAFIDEKHGFAGNIGTEYFPNVTDTRPLFETIDGGESWTAVENIPPLKGVCAIDIVKVPFINAGQLDHRTVLHVAGRVGGPAQIARSIDGGKSWSAIDLAEKTSMILDVKFFDADTGFVAAGSDKEIERSHAQVLMTNDGGKTWTEQYRSSRAFELSWKMSFPSRETGYATVQSYNEDPAVKQRWVAKTTDGGSTWKEVLLVEDAAVREFGIGFIDDEIGWVGAAPNAFETRDGGATWAPIDLGKAANKIRVLKTPEGYVGYSIGVEVFKLDARKR